MQGRERFFAGLRGEPVDRVPLFPILMFLSVDRAGLTYREFATNGHALAQAQLMMQERFGLDAITACSDAFRVSAALGGEMEYPEATPPHLVRPLVASRADLARLGHPDPTGNNRMGDRVRSVAEMARAAGERCAVVGWIEMPFAEACDLVGVSNMMMLTVDNPDLAHRILEFVTDIEIAFGLAQIAAGADMIGAGDAAASLISRAAFAEFALPYEQRVCAALHEAGSTVKLHICGNTRHLLEQMAGSGADLFNVDHLVPLQQARDVYAAHNLCYKGNLDPVSHIMQSNPEAVQAAALACIRIARGTRYMLSAGCEIPAGTSDEVFGAFCEAPRLA